MLAAKQPNVRRLGLSAQSALQRWLPASILARRHPLALGRPFFEVGLRPGGTHTALRSIIAGEPVNMDDITLLLDRRGRPREAHFAFSTRPCVTRRVLLSAYLALALTDRPGLAERQLYWTCSVFVESVLSAIRPSFRTELD